MPLLPSALPPKGEARRYVANDFLNLMALPARVGWRYENTLYSKTPRRFPIFMRRTTPVEPLEPLEPLEPIKPAPLFRSIKGQHAPEPRTPHLCYNRENHALYERNPR